MVEYKMTENEVMANETHEYIYKEYEVGKYTMDLTLQDGKVINIGTSIDMELIKKGYCNIYFPINLDDDMKVAFFPEIKMKSYYVSRNSIDDVIEKMILAKETLETMIDIIQKLDADCIIK